MTDQADPPETTIERETPPGPPPGPPPGVGEAVRRQEAVFKQLLDWISAADRKAQLIAAVDLALIGGLATAAATNTSQFLAQWWFVILAYVPVLASLWQAGEAVFPRLSNKESRSLLYFGSVARMSADAYAASVAGQSEAAHLDDLNRQCHALSEMCVEKYRASQRAITWLGVGLVCFVLAIIVLCAHP